MIERSTEHGWLTKYFPCCVGDVEQLALAILIFAGALLPFAWGWVVYKVLAKVWPQNDQRPPERSDIPPPLDYQI